jgi:hypothetical protein
MEVLHAELVRRSRRQGQGPSPCFSGKDARGELLKGHGHAWLIPLSLEQPGQIDHVLVHAVMGLEERACDALGAVRVPGEIRGRDDNDGGEAGRGGEGEMRLASRWRDFRSARVLRREQRPPVATGFGLRITFAEEVQRPIALGYASHFGPGAMEPER